MEVLWKGGQYEPDEHSRLDDFTRYLIFKYCMAKEEFVKFNIISEKILNILQDFDDDHEEFYSGDFEKLKNFIQKKNIVNKVQNILMIIRDEFISKNDTIYIKMNEVLTHEMEQFFKYQWFI